MSKKVTIVIEEHPDGYVGNVEGMNGAVVGEGDTFEEALNDVTTAIRFHLDIFGQEAFEHRRNDI